jgi:DNA-binding response OmpR family regulator
MKRILLIEDDKKIAAALCIRLQNAGYEVMTALDGLKGLAAAAQTRPDLVISDIWLPGTVGFMVAERLKNFGLDGVPVIFITASKKKDLWKLAQEVGAAGFFEKPFDTEKLLRAVARCLEQPPSLEGEAAHSDRLAGADFTQGGKEYS